MRLLYSWIREFFAKADMVLLALCLSASLFGILIISSATAYMNYSRMIIVQLVATGLGLIAYFIFSMIDIDIIAERREVLWVFSTILIAFLFTPLAVSEGGNKSWVKFPFLPFNVQPSEVCKITFIILLAKSMSIRQQNLSKFVNIIRFVAILGYLFVLLFAASRDAGSCLMYILIFAVMLWSGGVSWVYFALAIGGAAIGIPILWNLQIGGKYVLPDYQRNRILMIFDSSIDPNGVDIRWQTKNSLLTLTNGGISGMGLYNGSRTQHGELSQQHTDFIFSVIGEELGLLGCVLVIFLLFLVIMRCVQIGVRSGNFMNRQICIGIAAMIAWQMIINIGMCIGVTPVIGLTLPFFSYGGSSVLTLYAALGIVSGIHIRPAPDSEAHYLRAPY